MSCLNYCGGDDIVDDGDCWCDKECEFFNNCCPDYFKLCFTTNQPTTNQPTTIQPTTNQLTTIQSTTIQPITIQMTTGNLKTTASLNLCKTT